MSIHIDPAKIILHPRLARPKPYNPDAVDALSAAIQDADIEAGNYEDGLPSLAAWERVVECWQACERNTP